MEREFIGGPEIKRYIQHRTVIEDTESSHDALLPRKHRKWGFRAALLSPNVAHSLADLIQFRRNDLAGLSFANWA